MSEEIISDEEVSEEPEKVLEEPQEPEEDEEKAKLKQQVANLNAALREERMSKRELKATLQPSHKEEAPTEDYYLTRTEAERLAEEKAREVVSSFAEQTTKDNEKKALRRFYQEFPSYDPVNDTDNSQFSALARFYVNRSGSSIDDIYADLLDAHYLLNRKNDSMKKIQPYADSGIGPVSKKGEGPVKPEIKLTKEQKEIAKRFGMTEEAYWQSLQES